MDRNEQARQEFALAQQRRAFAQAVTSGQAAVLDRLAQPVAKGALVLWRPPHDLIYEVVDVAPVLDPRQPPGLVQLTLMSTAPVTFYAGQPAMSLVVIGQQHAEGHAELTTPSGARAENPAAALAETAAVADEEAPQA